MTGVSRPVFDILQQDTRSVVHPRKKTPVILLKNKKKVEDGGWGEKSLKIVTKGSLLSLGAVYFFCIYQFEGNNLKQIKIRV